jgi:hypothetical protein
MAQEQRPAAQSSGQAAHDRATTTQDPRPANQDSRAAAALPADSATAETHPTADGSATGESTAALNRLRSALARPASRLTLAERTPDFTVHIEKRRPMADIFDVPAWATDPVGWQPPALGFDLLSVFRSVAKSVADAKRGHDVRLAREEVQQAIAGYCAALPAADSPTAANDSRPAAADASRPSVSAAAAQICSTSPAIR